MVKKGKKYSKLNYLLIRKKTPHVKWFIARIPAYHNVLFIQQSRPLCEEHFKLTYTSWEQAAKQTYSFKASTFVTEEPSLKTHNM